jgi:hypothetical protein
MKKSRGRHWSLDFCTSRFATFWQKASGIDVIFNSPYPKNPRKSQRTNTFSLTAAFFGEFKNAAGKAVC